MTTADEIRTETERVHHSLTNITPTDEQVHRIEAIRASGKGLATAIINANPGPSRERALALTKLEECVMWAVKSVLDNE